jgi:hypothetical protein
MVEAVVSDGVKENASGVNHRAFFDCPAATLALRFSEQRN